MNGPFSARKTAEIGAEIAGALEFAHRNGVVHRDVKPGNVLITADGDIKVTDFGIARAGTSEALTQTGAVMGTAAYFSPEQAQGFAVDGRSDVYSLGVVLYEMVTGGPPFTAESPVTVAYMHVREEPEPPGARAPDLPPDLEKIILTAMAKDPDSRYQTADELRSDLLRFGRGQPPLGGPVTGLVADGTATAAVASTQAAPVAALGGHDPDEHRRKRRGALVAGILGALVIAGVIIALLASGGGGGGGGAPTAEVPNVINKPFAEAEQALKFAGFKVDRNDVEGKDAPDLVLSQKPTGGEKLKKNGTVHLQVSKATFTMPDVTGKLRGDAINELINLGFQDRTNGVVSREVDSDQPPNTVLGSDPPPGAQVAKAGQQVTLLVGARARDPDTRRGRPGVANRAAAPATGRVPGLAAERAERHRAGPARHPHRSGRQRQGEAWLVGDDVRVDRAAERRRPERRGPDAESGDPDPGAGGLPGLRRPAELEQPVGQRSRPGAEPGCRPAAAEGLGRHAHRR